jgi:hypothetical protein
MQACMCGYVCVCKRSAACAPSGCDCVRRRERRRRKRCRCCTGWRPRARSRGPEYADSGAESVSRVAVEARLTFSPRLLAAPQHQCEGLTGSRREHECWHARACERLRSRAAVLTAFMHQEPAILRVLVSMHVGECWHWQGFCLLVRCECVNARAHACVRAGWGLGVVCRCGLVRVRFCEVRLLHSVCIHACGHMVVRPCPHVSVCVRLHACSGACMACMLLGTTSAQDGVRRRHCGRQTRGWAHCRRA